jgi:hypothetical protein
MGGMAQDTWDRIRGKTMQYDAQIETVLNTTAYDEPKDYLREWLGVLPYWVKEFNLLNGDDIVAFMNGCYGYGLYKFEGEVLEDGTYRSQYDDDDDMPFIGKMATARGDVYFYPYGMVALPTSDGYFVTRMD